MSSSGQAQESPNTDAYANALRNIQETTTTATGLLGLYQQFRGEFGSYHAWNKQIEDLKDDLGEWALMVFRPDKSWWLPVLRTKPFEEYLSDALGSCEEGALRPTGDCNTSVGWAKLLHALALRPTDTTPLEWRRMSRNFDASTPGAIRLELESRVLCHIVNLFRVYDCESNGFGPDDEDERREPYSYTLQFGELNLKRDTSPHGEFVATFRESSQSSLSQKACPFKLEPPVVPWIWKIETMGYGTAYVSYRMALTYGISPTRAALSADADHHKKTRKERAKNLLQSVSDVALSDTQLFLITRRWINDVVRIWRRITVNPDSQGNPDTRLVDFLAEDMSASAKVRTLLEKELPRYPERARAEFIREAVQNVCMFSSEFSIGWTQALAPRSESWDERIIREVKKLVCHSLPRLKDAWEGEWNTQLGEMVDDEDQTLAKIFALDRIVFGRPTLFMELSEGHELWDTNVRCYVDG